MKRALFACSLLVTLTRWAHAGPWTRDEGHFYLETSYSRIAARNLFGPDGNITPIIPYQQHLWNLYAEVGLLKRWATATVEATLFRHNSLAGEGATYGMGDWRVGLWSGLVEKPFRLSIGTTVGIPIGDPRPNAVGGDAEAQQIARSLPTGDGEWDVEWRVALGYSFGGVRRYPLQHYLIAEAGYWLRTHGFADAFVYKLEFGVRFPWKFIERFWFIVRLTGVESFASVAEASMDATGLGNGLTFVSPGVELYGRIVKGFGASVSWADAVRARSVAAGSQLKVAINYQW